jgi:hypothetical protein
MNQTESGKCKNYEGPANKHKINEAKNPMIHNNLREINLEKMSINPKEFVQIMFD